MNNQDKAAYFAARREALACIARWQSARKAHCDVLMTRWRIRYEQLLADMIGIASR